MSKMEEYREDCIRGITEAMREGKPFNMVLVVMCNTKEDWMRFAHHARECCMGDKTNSYNATILRAAADYLDKNKFKTVVTEFAEKGKLN